MSEEQIVTLAEAVTMYLATLSREQRHEGQQELNKFVRWWGGERPIKELNAREIGDYSDSVSSAHLTDPVKKLEPVRSFLTYARKRKLIDVSLASHLRVSKAKPRRVGKGGSREPVAAALSSEGYAVLASELEELKGRRPKIVEQIQHAMADKDFRENAPLDAAKEHQGKVEARIRQIETTLKGSTLVEAKAVVTHTVGIGCTVGLCDLSTGEQSCYILVSPSEANPAQGKLSFASPIGKAVMEREVGAVVEVIAPIGKILYRIEEITG